MAAAWCIPNCPYPIPDAFLAQAALLPVRTMPEQHQSSGGAMGVLKCEWAMASSPHACMPKCMQAVSFVAAQNSGGSHPFNTSDVLV
jgi:hypothetical protein